MTGQLPLEGHTGKGGVVTSCCTLQLHCSFIYWMYELETVRNLG